MRRPWISLIGLSLLGGLFILVALAEPEVRQTGKKHIALRANQQLPLRPVARVPRDQYATVRNLDVLLYPGVDASERAAVTEGFAFFTTPHTPEEGAGPVANQRFCLGCHGSSAEALPDSGLVTCADDSCNTQVSRAARSTPTNFAITALDPTTGGGVAADDDDALGGPGRTAAFTLFGDFSPVTNTFNGLIEFGGTVQHTRPSLPGCLPDPILPVEKDPFLQGGVDPSTGLSPLGFRRAVGERAGPPYIGRGLMEAVADADILGNEDPEDRSSHTSSLAAPAVTNPECGGDCISGRHNESSTAGAFVGGEPEVRLGRFGLRAAGPTILQFVIGGAQGELGFSSPFSPAELNKGVNVGRPDCVDPVPDPDLSTETILSIRNLIRLTAPPEFGASLLALLQSDNPRAPRPPDTPEERVRRGAILFGVDLEAFANRMVAGRMPAGGDGRDPHAISQSDRRLNCVGCHTPIQATAASPSEVGARHLSFVWAPLFSDLLIHDMGEVTPERQAPTPRLPFQRADGSFDIARNLADDALPGQGIATGREFRTPPLMGMGRVGTPFLHDARVYLSQRTVQSTPASTVFSNATVGTNAALSVTTLEDAIRAAIELHDLPPPDDASTPDNSGCPVPTDNRLGNLVYPQGAADICPPYDGDTSQLNRSEARNVMRRWRQLSAADQRAVIEFLKQL